MYGIHTSHTFENVTPTHINRLDSMKSQISCESRKNVASNPTNQNDAIPSYILKSKLGHLRDIDECLSFRLGNVLPNFQLSQTSMIGQTIGKIVKKPFVSHSSSYSQTNKYRMSEPEPITATSASYFFGFMGAVSALVFTCKRIHFIAFLILIFSLTALGSSYGTAKAGVGVCNMGVMRPELVMKSVIPCLMAGMIGIYGLIIALLIVLRSKLVQILVV